MSLAKDVLLVEDNAEEAKLLLQLLENIEGDIIVSHVTNGQEACKFLRRERPYTEARWPALILLDWHMPVMDGEGFLQAIKEQESFKQIPVVVLTDSLEREHLSIAYRLGAINYIVKPMTRHDSNQLLRFVESILFTRE